MSLGKPLSVLGVGQHTLASAFHLIGIDIHELFVHVSFECSMTLALLIIPIPQVLFLIFSFDLAKMFFHQARLLIEMLVPRSYREKFEYRSCLQDGGSVLTT